MIGQTESKTTTSKSSFAHDVLKIASAPAFTQVAGILVIPLITRLYAPEAFGLLALWGSIFAPLEAFTTMGYSASIMLPKSDEESATMFGVCLTSATLASGLTILLILFGQNIILNFLKAPELRFYLWLVPACIFLSGLLQSLRYWNMRNRRFGRIATARISSYIAKNGIILGAGFAGYVTALSLIAGSLADSIVSPAVLSRRILRDHGNLFKRKIRWSAMIAGIKRYRKFPIYMVPTQLVSRFAGEIPIYLLSYYFSQSIIGYYSLGLRLLNMPMSFLGNSIGEVYFQRAAQNKSNNKLLENLYKRLVLFGLLPFLLLGLIGKDLFSFLFGANWSEAGVYAQILSFSILVRFLTVPASYLMLILEKQQFSLILNIINIVIGILSITIGGLLGNVYISFILLSGLTGLLHAVYGFWFMKQAGLSLYKIFKITWHFLIISLPVLIIVSLAKWYFHLSPFSVLVISGAGVLIFYCITLRRDEKVRSFVVDFLGKIHFIRMSFL